MKFSEAWLREWLDIELTTQQLADQLTMAGLEVESITDNPHLPQDNIIDIELTPNRGDCCSILGVAREVAALNDVPMAGPSLAAVTKQNTEEFPITIEMPAACPVYVGRVIKNIKLTNALPDWIQQRLLSGGIRQVNPVVDITNYVMLELGQPMHAFDLHTLKQQIIVRKAKAAEKLILLDGQEIELSPESLVIADSVEPIALAGIMGGVSKGVTLETKDVFLESAFFDPVLISEHARKYSISTDSSYRFERGVDFELQQKACERATELICKYLGGEPGPVINHTAEANLPQQAKIKFRTDRSARILGVQIPATDLENIFQRLHFKVSKTDSGWEVAVPSYRFDVNIEADLIEEIARVYGYDNLPVNMPAVPSNIAVNSTAKLELMQVKEFFKARGYNEAITYSFISERLQQLSEPDTEAIAVLNPISQTNNTMRTNLWSGLLEVAVANQHNQQARLKLFETGLRFNKINSAITQTPTLSGISFGSVNPEFWQAAANRAGDFFDLKGDLQALLEATNTEFEWQKFNKSGFHPGQCASIIISDTAKVIGYAGAIHPELLQSLDLQGPVYAFELDLEPILSCNVSKYKPYSRFPTVRRDIAILVETSVSVAKLLKCIAKTLTGDLLDLILFDVYHGKGVPPGQKSVAIGLIFQGHEHTLTEAEISGLVTKAIEVLQNQFQAKLRD